MESRIERSETQPVERASHLLEEAQQAVKDGNDRRAYELSLQATQTAPDYAQAWALRTHLAPSLEEKIVCLNRLNELEPDHQGNHQITFHFLNEILDRDPFLSYMEETKDLYHVVNKDLMVLRIPKSRTATQPYPPEQASPLRPAYRWLALGMFGLLFAGIPTLIFASLAARSALNVSDSLGQQQASRIPCTLVEIGAILLFAVGCFFSVLFLLHLT